MNMCVIIYLETVYVDKKKQKGSIALAIQSNQSHQTKIHENKRKQIVKSHRRTSQNIRASMNGIEINNNKSTTENI